MRIAVTGGAGFIGANFVNYWIKKYPAHEIIVIDKDTLQMGKFGCSDEFIASGEDKAKRAIDNYHKFFGEESWEDVDQYFIEEIL